MIHYIVADDVESTRTSINRFLQKMIQTEFGVPAQGTICSGVTEALSEIKKVESDIDLIVLDMEFHRDLAGGLSILKALKPQLRRKVVVYSAHLDEQFEPTGPRLSEELRTVYAIPADRAIDMMQGSDALWNACFSILSNKFE